jgi:RNA polymerase sigma factor (sigma-70 family)
VSVNLNTLHQNAVAGDQAAEKSLFDRLIVSFRLIAQRKIRSHEDAEEVIQEALKTVAEKYAQLEIESSFSGWAHQVLSNKIFDYVKVKAARGKHQAEMEDEHMPEIGIEEDPLFHRRLIECLRTTFKSNRRYARVLNLHYQGFNGTEICERLGISSGNLYVTLSRARRALATCLKSGKVQL